MNTQSVKIGSYLFNDGTISKQFATGKKVTAVIAKVEDRINGNVFALSVEEKILPWAKEFGLRPGALDTVDGIENCQILEQKGLRFYPAAAHCFYPDELIYLGSVEEMLLPAENITAINAALQAIEEKPLSKGVPYLSSTEWAEGDNRDDVHVVYYSDVDPENMSHRYPKTGEAYVRAMYALTVE